MHEINEALVLKLHSAWRRTAAASRGLMYEIVGAEQGVSRALGQLRQAELQMQIYPNTERPDPGEAWEDFEYRRNQADQRRGEAEAQLRRNLRAAGASMNPAQFAGAVERVTVDDFAAALADARHNLARAEDTVRQLREEQGIMGSKAGLLRRSLQESAAWLRANGHASLATEIEP